MNVSVKVKEDYRNNSIMKYVKLSFPQLGMTINNDQIYTESLKLTESLCESANIEFVGCIASCFKIKVNNLRRDIKGKRIVAHIYTENTEDEPIKLFDGYVDSVIRDSNKRSKEITAYDALYTKGNIEVKDWYNSLSFPLNIKTIRNSLFRYLGIEEVFTELPNDYVMINKQYKPSTLQALTVIKSICQINGAMGIINRDGQFEYRILAKDILVPTIPSVHLFPSTKKYPYSPIQPQEGVESVVDAESFAFYRSVDFEEFTVQPIDKVTIRQSETDKDTVTYGEGVNNYIIQANMFTKGLSKEVRLEIAKNVYFSVGGFKFIPFKSSNNGLPWLECGLDAVAYEVYNYDYNPNSRSANNNEFKQETFYVMNREMTGIQALKDSYIAEGEEYQNEFITDLQTQIDSLKQGGNLEDYYDREEIDSIISGLETPTGFNIVSCYKLPSSVEANTLYCIQGGVIIL